MTGHAAQPAGNLSPQARAGRSPVLDAAQLEVLRRYGTENDMGAGEVLFADGDLTYTCSWCWLFLETSRPGVFAVGDVRSGSIKRETVREQLRPNFGLGDTGTTARSAQ